MGWTTSIGVYVIIWWVVLFMVLPWGVRTIEQDDVARGHAPSAPKMPRIALKAAVTSLVAAAVWLVVYTIIESGAISVRN